MTRTMSTTHTVSTTRRPSALVGLVGTGIAPSLTPAMHELEGARHGINYVYRLIEMPEAGVTQQDLARVLDSARQMRFTGLNITHPFKQRIIPLLDELDDRAARLGAVNTVRFVGDRGIGSNTDVSGFGWAFEESLGDAIAHRVVVIGAGGAGSAVVAALAERNTAEIIIVDQDTERAAALAATATAWTTQRVSSAPSSELASLLPTVDGLVNATPFGMAEHPGSAFDLALLTDDMWVADIVYRPTVTPLLREASGRGLRVMAGTGMAMAQAADSFELFTGNIADRSAMLADLQDLVAREAATESASR